MTWSRTQRSNITFLENRKGISTVHVKVFREDLQADIVTHLKRRVRADEMFVDSS